MLLSGHKREEELARLYHDRNRYSPRVAIRRDQLQTALVHAQRCAVQVDLQCNRFTPPRWYAQTIRCDRNFVRWDRRTELVVQVGGSDGQ